MRVRAPARSLPCRRPVRAGADLVACAPQTRLRCACMLKYTDAASSTVKFQQRIAQHRPVDDGTQTCRRRITGLYRRCTRLSTPKHRLVEGEAQACRRRVTGLTTTKHRPVNGACRRRSTGLYRRGTRLSTPRHRLVDEEVQACRRRGTGMSTTKHRPVDDEVQAC